MTNEETRDIRQSYSGLIGKAVPVLLYVAVILLSLFTFGKDFPEFIGWFLMLVASGITFFPVSLLLFRRFRDCGILFSITLGVGFMSWLSWFMASTGFIPFTSWGCSIIMLICAALNICILVITKKIKGSVIPKDLDLSSKITPMLLSGLIFLVALFIWTYMRGFKPDALGDTESIMDYAFMKSLDKSYYMPATDMWMAGKSLNYYYVGQYIATFMSKISGVGVGYGYNLMLMTEAAMAFALPYSIVSTAFADYIDSKGVKRKASAHAAGIISGIGVSLCGNFHYLIFYYVVPMLRDITGLSNLKAKGEISLPEYFFPNSTRYIGYMPETADKTIHEFPAYSFVLGDLHAHVINIMFVLCVVAVLYGYIAANRDRMKLAAVGMIPPADTSKNHTCFGIEHFFGKVFSPHVIIVAFFIGLFHTTNYWDFPIYFVVAGAVILYVNFVSEGGRFSGFVLTAFHAAIVVIISLLVCLPFTLSFDKISSDIAAVTTRTPFYQFMILWGFPFIVGTVFIVTVIKHFVRSASTPAETGKRRFAITRFLLETDHSDIFMLIVVLCAMGLTLIPEMVYVKDIYSGDFKRANTMFKITYQAFILFGMSFGYIFARLLIFGKKGVRVFGIVALGLLLLSSGYTKLAADSWFFSGDKTFTGISSDAFLENVDNGEYKAITFLNENISGRPVIIEANGDSYTRECRFSAWTGLPTILGWRTHEWLWRSSGNDGYPKILAEREADVRKFYTTDKMSEMREIIDKYDISYIIIGGVEREKYGSELREEKLVELGDIVFENDAVKIVRITK